MPGLDCRAEPTTTGLGGSGHDLGVAKNLDHHIDAERDRVAYLLFEFPD